MIWPGSDRVICLTPVWVKALSVGTGFILYAQNKKQKKHSPLQKTLCLPGALPQCEAAHAVIILEAPKKLQGHFELLFLQSVAVTRLLARAIWTVYAAKKLKGSI